jgi:hypothetical protein
LRRAGAAKGKGLRAARESIAHRGDFERPCVEEDLHDFLLGCLDLDPESRPGELSWLTRARTHLRTVHPPRRVASDREGLRVEQPEPVHLSGGTYRAHAVVGWRHQRDLDRGHVTDRQVGGLDDDRSA